MKFEVHEVDEPSPSISLHDMAHETAERLLKSGHKVAVTESSTGGLLAAALQAVPGASSYTTFNAVTYSRRSTAAALPGLKIDLDAPRPTNAKEYMASKLLWTSGLATAMHDVIPAATWCVSESGACGPTFTVPDLTTGFTVIGVSGPVSKGWIIKAASADRERNMRLFVKAALDLLAACMDEALAMAVDATPEQTLEAADAESYTTVNDRYGGVMLTALQDAPAPARFGNTLRRHIVEWRRESKRGLWLKIPAERADLVAEAVAAGFQFHHAKPEYLQLTMWLLDTPSPLPLYAFTQIGVGGVVLNARGEVLLVQERVSPSAQYQGSWKLPGGLADPGESFAETAKREVMEETGVAGDLVGVVSLRHTHGYRFDQSDIYVLVRLQATQEDMKMDGNEIAAAQWMHPDYIKTLVEYDSSKPYKDKVSATNWNMISNAVYGRLIVGTDMPSHRGRSMLYTASDKDSNL
eukprot:m.165538 g.165538  ORF g.165538 m.165538 type:complete len:467 (+) comp12576_c0_seq1:214-1614(+)